MHKQVVPDPHRFVYPWRSSRRNAISFLLISSLILIIIGIVAVSVNGASSSAAIEAVLAWLFNLGITLFVAFAAWNQNIAAHRAGCPPPRMGTAVFAPLVLMAVTLPAGSLVWRSRTANVEKLTSTELATPEALSFSLLLFSACLVSFWLGEGLLRSARRLDSPPILTTAARPKWKWAQSFLMLIGLAASLSQLGGNRAVEFAERGTQVGQGVLVLAWWCLPLGVAIGVLHKHWGAKWRMILSFLGIALIINSGVRSPLILVALACIPLLVQAIARTSRPLRILTFGVAGGYALITLGGAISVWRGSIRYGAPVSLGDALFNAALDPFKTLTMSGLDTVDGLLLVYSLPPHLVDVNLLDLLKVIQTMIPSQFYPDKPEFISNIISRELLGYGAAGMFMSGPGYLILIGGSWLAAVLLFFLGGLIYSKVAVSVGGVSGLIATYTLVRFVMGGDAFDFYQGLTLIAISGGSLILAAFVSTIAKRVRSPKTISMISGVTRD